MISAVGSSSGKTLFTSGLIRALKNRGETICPFKVGPDFIDPAYLSLAAGTTCYNLDPWAMRPTRLAELVHHMPANAYAVVEGVMGLFDGARDGTGSTADLSAQLGWPVILLVDVAGQGATAAAVVRGCLDHMAEVRPAAVVFNRVGGLAHQDLLEEAMAQLPVPILGYLERRPELSLPSRHLGLVQAGELENLDQILNQAADWVAGNIDLSRLTGFFRPAKPHSLHDHSIGWQPLAQHVAVARDHAFGFCYPHLLNSWRRIGVEISFFSPLADETPNPSAGAVFLPGGYPELYAGVLSQSGRTIAALKQTQAEGKVIYGECGGYMFMGEALVDRQGQSHAMAGLLPLVTSFENPKIHLGYRRVLNLDANPLGVSGLRFRGHEFHYATEIDNRANALFGVSDARGDKLGKVGARVGQVFGSFVHLVDLA